MGNKVSGTASVLKQTKIYEELVEEYSTEVADGLLAKAINSNLPNANVTPSDVAGFSKITTALRTGSVDLSETADKAKSDASAVAHRIISNLKSPQKEEENK